MTQNKHQKICVVFILFLSISLLPFQNIYAATNRGNLHIGARYDDDITPQKTDNFVIEYENNDTGDTGEFKINTYDCATSLNDIEIRVGVYTATKIEYEGKNKQIANTCYGTENKFYITENARN